MSIIRRERETLELNSHESREYGKAIDKEIALGWEAGMPHWVKAGTWLIEAKKRVPHGEWYHWVDMNTSLSKQGAEQYMRIARHEDELREQIRTSGTVLTSKNQALALIARPRKANAKDPEDEEIIDAELIEEDDDEEDESAVHSNGKSKRKLKLTRVNRLHEDDDEEDEEPEDEDEDEDDEEEEPEEDDNYPYARTAGAGEGRWDLGWSRTHGFHAAEHPPANHAAAGIDLINTDWRDALERLEIGRRVFDDQIKIIRRNHRGEL